MYIYILYVLMYMYMSVPIYIYIYVLFFFIFWCCFFVGPTRTGTRCSPSGAALAMAGEGG